MRRTSATTITALVAGGALFALTPSAYAAMSPDLRSAGTPASIKAGGGTAFSPWKFYPSKPFTVSACNTKIRIAAPVNHEEERHRKDSGGNTIQEVRGQYVSEFTEVGSSKHYYFDTSGESVGQYHTVAYANGDFLFQGTGNNVLGLHTNEQVATGLVQPVHGRYFDEAIVVTSGPLRVINTTDAKGVRQTDLITRPRSTVNVCAVMGFTP